MTQEQFKEVIKINKRIEQLKKALKEFELESSCRLSLVYGGYGIDEHWDIHYVNQEIIDSLEDKLKVYTKRFIQELKEELKELNKKIENV